jgi:hypothetical protein
MTAQTRAFENGAKNTSREPKKIHLRNFARAHNRNSGLGYGSASNIAFFTVTDVIFLSKSTHHVMLNDSSHFNHAVYVHTETPWSRKHADMTLQKKNRAIF